MVKCVNILLMMVQCMLCNVNNTFAKTQRVLKRIKPYVTVYFLTVLLHQSSYRQSLGVKRVQGNKKGILTRQRQPKQAAYVLRNRYLNLNISMGSTKRDEYKNGKCTC